MDECLPLHRRLVPSAGSKVKDLRPIRFSGFCVMQSQPGIAPGAPTSLLAV